MMTRFIWRTLCLWLLLPTALWAQVNPDKLSYEEDQQHKTLLAAALKAKPGTQPLDLTDATRKRAFDLTSRVEQLGLLKLNQSMLTKKYAHDSDFVAYYIARYSTLFDETKRNAWLLAYSAGNPQEKAFFEKELSKTGLKGDKREKILLSYYALKLRVERVFYIEIVSLVYKNNEADFSLLPKRAKDWVAAHNDLFP